MRWELCSHATCKEINVIYYLKCNMCDHKETYNWKKVGSNVVGSKSRFNQHVNDCRTGTSACKFPINVYHYAMKNKRLKEPYFQLNIMMKLKNSQQLECYENHFHKKGYDTINYPEYLKKQLNTLCWVCLANATNLFFAVVKLHSEEQMRKALV